MLDLEKYFSLIIQILSKLVLLSVSIRMLWCVKDLFKQHLPFTREPYGVSGLHAWKTFDCCYIMLRLGRRYQSEN